MPYKLHPKHEENVLSFNSRERYDYFVRKVADWEQLWGLYSDKGGWFIRETPEGLSYFSVWPHPTFAIKIIEAWYPEHLAKEITLHEFIHNLLPQFEIENIKIGVFPDFNGTTWIMEPLDLKNDLEEECKFYE